MAARCVGVGLLIFSLPGCHYDHVIIYCQYRNMFIISCMLAAPLAFFLQDMLGVSDLAKQPGPTTNGSGKAAEESSKGSHRYSLPGPPSRLAPGNTTDGAVASKAKTRHSIGVPPSRGTVSSRSSSGVCVCCFRRRRRRCHYCCLLLYCFWWFGLLIVVV